MQEILSEVVHDTLRVLPLLFVVYLFLEWLEHKSMEKYYHKIISLQKLGPIIGAIIGCIPQCGFSMIAGILFAQGFITPGTLIAVFISTSDEALPILISHPDQSHFILYFILIKLLFGILAGYLLDALYHPDKEIITIDTETLHMHHSIFFSALYRSIKVIFYIFMISLCFSLAIYYIGEENVSSMLFNNTWFQPILASLFGFIPNCMPSILLSQLYILHSIHFGSLIAGLSTNAGLGIITLLKYNQDKKENLLLLAYMFIISSIAGICLFLFL